MIRAIVAVDKNWAIGKEGKLLTSIPDDQRFFRLTTTDQVVIKTIPKKKKCKKAK